MMNGLLPSPLARWNGAAIERVTMSGNAVCSAEETVVHERQHCVRWMGS